MKALIRSTIMALLLCVSAPVSAGPLEDGVTAYEVKEYATALRLLIPLAEQGNAEAQFYLGVMFDYGEGVPQNYAAALGWFRKSADQGIAQAQLNLGNMYRKGQGVPQDYVAAVGWYLKAADLGYAAAQNNLGAMYDEGEGVPQNYVQAHKWYNLAASRHKASDIEQRERAVRNRDNLAKKMTPAQIAEAQKLAREWKQKTSGQ